MVQKYKKKKTLDSKINEISRISRTKRFWTVPDSRSYHKAEKVPYLCVSPLLRLCLTTAGYCTIFCPQTRIHSRWFNCVDRYQFECTTWSMCPIRPTGTPIGDGVHDLSSKRFSWPFPRCFLNSYLSVYTFAIS